LHDKDLICQKNAQKCPSVSRRNFSRLPIFLIVYKRNFSHVIYHILEAFCYRSNGQTDGRVKTIGVAWKRYFGVVYCLKTGQFVDELIFRASPFYFVVMFTSIPKLAIVIEKVEEHLTKATKISKNHIYALMDFLPHKGNDT
jgi:hypothetical protein